MLHDVNMSVSFLDDHDWVRDNHRVGIDGITTWTCEKCGGSTYVAPEKLEGKKYYVCNELTDASCEEALVMTVLES